MDDRAAAETYKELAADPAETRARTANRDRLERRGRDLTEDAEHGGDTEPEKQG